MWERLGSREYVGIFLALAVLALLMAAGFRTQDLLLAGLTLGLYGLHLISIRSIRERQEQQSALLREVGTALDDLGLDEGARRSDGEGEADRPAQPPAGPSPAGGDGDARASPAAAEAGGAPEGDGDTMVPRELRIGTVAIVEGALEPDDVSRVMAMQDRRPDRPFGELAVEAGLLTPSRVEELLEMQRTGLYSRRRLKQAKSKLRAFLGRAGD